MSSWSNYDDVLDQLRGFGLLVESIDVSRIVRCKVEGGDREKRGWYQLHEFRTSAGDMLLVGSYGVWHGNENNAQKIQLKKRELSNDERAAIKDRIDADKKREAERRKRIADKAARKALGAWSKCSNDGESAYLKKKGVAAHGVRFSGRGNLVIPIQDTRHNIHGLQIIYGDPETIKRKGRDKDYWPSGLAKQGHFFLIGPPPTSILLVTEGYATGASLFEATTYPAAIAFDAGNLLPVAKALRKRYPGVKILICGDDDWRGKCAHCQKMTPVADEACKHCGEPHGRINAGAEAADKTAFAIGGAWMLPEFPDRGDRKLTDFNDLHMSDPAGPEVGLRRVQDQVEAKIQSLGWNRQNAAPQTPQQGGGGRDEKLKPIESSDELLDRFALVYAHKQTVFDSQEHILMTLGDMRDACIHKDVHRRWMENPARRIVRVQEVGFDPAGMDPRITCNLFGGWPTEPKKGTSIRLLELLEYLCSAEDNPEDIKRWILCWLAYPIQNPGAKMKTALVLHGPQGVGKNLFFESIMAIYGEYGRIINQDAVEDKYNDWASKKLFMIADEVVARQELYHTKNKLKGLITNDTIRINPKFVTSYEEVNHVNLVFLSNETQPLVLERDDRRYTVIWTPPKLGPAMYDQVGDEIANGGIEALHYHLKFEIDLSKYYKNQPFTPHTKPPMTKAKAELIDLSQDNTERFWLAWINDEIGDIPVVPCKSRDFYELYRSYCGRLGYPRYAPEPKLLAEVGKRSDCKKAVTWYIDKGDDKQATFIFPPGAETPLDTNKRDWVTTCANQFRQALDRWKDPESA